MPVDELVALEAETGIRYLRPPLNVSIPIDPPRTLAARPEGSVAGGPIVGQEVAKTNADEWHAAGFTGAGVKIGIIDVFDSNLWSAAIANGDLPSHDGSFCRVNGLPCNLFTYDTGFPGAEHGVAVAEVIHEMAPGAQLYLARVATTSDLQAAINNFDDRGVHIISRSLTSRYDGPGDGTGPVASVIDNAVADGMVWFNSAGNNATDGIYNAGLGTYWRGSWTDSNLNGSQNFGPGDDHLGFTCGSVNGIRWNDFGEAVPTDYDIYVFDEPSSLLPFYASDDFQGSGGSDPIEMLDFPCIFGDIDYLEIRLFAPGGGTAGDTIEFMANRGAFEYGQNSYSASGPASDTNSPGALSIGAIDPPNGTSIAPYSSQGPTNDGRTKPDISVASCVSSYTYFSEPCGTGGFGFNGTSAAAPAAAGAAALLIDAGVATTPAQIKTYLLNTARVDRGAPGPDNVYGAGELMLPAPPADATPTPTNTPVAPPTNTPTNTPPAPTSTPTFTHVAPTDTPTSVVAPTDTPTGVPPTATPTPNVPTATDTPTALAPTDTPTFTPTLTFTPTFTRTPTRTPTPQDEPGDASCDGRVNALDAALVLQLTAGLIDEVPCEDGADASGNGRVDALDAALILQYDAGIIDEL